VPDSHQPPITLRPFRTQIDQAPSSTTDRVAAVLLAFAGSSDPLGVSEIARNCALSKAVVHRILQSLLQAGLVAYVPADRRYKLGPAALALGRHAMRQDDLYAAGAPTIAHLAEVTGETSTLSARIGHRRRYIAQVESAHRIRVAVQVGEVVGLAVGASGMAILAFMPQDDIDHVLSQPLSAYTEKTVTDPEQIRARLEQIRANGWVHTSGERMHHSSSVAAPIFDAAGEPAGALSIAYFAERRPDPRRLVDLVLTASSEVSQRLQQRQLGLD